MIQRSNEMNLQILRSPEQGKMLLANVTSFFNSRIWVLSALLIGLIIQFAVGISYPLNVAMSDNPAYLEMIQKGISNLMLASGYPFVLHGLLSAFGIASTQDIFDSVWLDQIQLTQNLIHAIFLVLATYLAKRWLGASIAGLFALAMGTNAVILGGINTAAPEWLQGDLVVLFMLLLTNLLNQKSASRKILVGSLAGIIGMLAYLVKFNSLIPLAIIATFFLLGKADIRIKAKSVFAGVTAAFALLAIFTGSFHKPSTGTSDLNYDHAWILMYAIEDNYFERPNEVLGDSSLRWKALNIVLPPGVAYGYQNVDDGGSPEERLKGKENYNLIMAATRDELIAFLSKYQLPATFNQGGSAVPIYWHVGLKEADELGVQVYKEYLQSNWIGEGLTIVSALPNFSLANVQFLPTFQDPQGITFESSDGTASTVDYTLPSNVTPQFQEYWNPKQSISLIGLSLLSTLAIISAWTNASMVFLMLGLVLGILRRKDQTHLNLLTGSLAVVIFYLGSVALVGFRHKEVMAALPLSLLLVLLSAKLAVKFLTDRVADRRSVGIAGSAR